jgi:hypothetical protein
MKEKTYSYTQMPNKVFDEFQAKIGDSELSLLMVIGRKTCGFHKRKDKIALSTFEECTGKARDTIIRALKELEGGDLIIRDRSTIPHSYQFSEKILSNEGVENQDVEISNLGPIVKPTVVGYSNQEEVGLSNPQKKPLKQKEINTTSTISSEDYRKVCSYWNKTFGGSLDPEEPNMERYIHAAIEEFSANGLIQAMYNRSRDDYYRNKVPYLREDPGSFFKHHKTIRNDLKRKPDNLFTYKQMVHKVTTEGVSMDDFKRLEDQFDNQGISLWEKV